MPSILDMLTPDDGAVTLEDILAGMGGNVGLGGRRPMDERLPEFTNLPMRGDGGMGGGTMPAPGISGNGTSDDIMAEILRKVTSMSNPPKRGMKDVLSDALMGGFSAGATPNVAGGGGADMMRAGLAGIMGQQGNADRRRTLYREQEGLGLNQLEAAFRSKQLSEYRAAQLDVADRRAETAAKAVENKSKPPAIWHDGAGHMGPNGPDGKPQLGENGQPITYAMDDKDVAARLKTVVDNFRISYPEKSEDDLMSMAMRSLKITPPKAIDVAPVKAPNLAVLSIPQLKAYWSGKRAEAAAKIADNPEDADAQQLFTEADRQMGVLDPILQKQLDDKIKLKTTAPPRAVKSAAARTLTPKQQADNEVSTETEKLLAAVPKKENGEDDYITASKRLSTITKESVRNGVREKLFKLMRDAKAVNKGNGRPTRNSGGSTPAATTPAKKVDSAAAAAAYMSKFDKPKAK